MFLHGVEGERGEALEVLRLAVHVVEAEHRVGAQERVQAGTRGSRDDRQMTHLGTIVISKLKFQCCGVCKYFFRIRIGIRRSVILNYGSGSVSF
jgi:hypothetical protein